MVFALLRRSAASERPTLTCLLVNLPFLRRTKRLFPRGAIIVRGMGYLRSLNAMVCYVSSPVAFGMIERRLYFSCACGMIAARNEEDVVISPPALRIEDGT